MTPRRPSRRLVVTLGAAIALSNLGLKPVAAAVVERPLEAVHRTLAQADGRRVFAIPAGPLDEALKAFTVLTGIGVSVDPIVVRGRRRTASPG